VKFWKTDFRLLVKKISEQLKVTYLALIFSIAEQKV